MKDKLLQHKTFVIVAAAVILTALGFAAGMMVKTSLAKDSSDYIGAERAKTIALESVGVSSSKATFTKVQIDREGTKITYDIEFFTTANEYDFEIDAISGEILEKQSEALKRESSLPVPSQQNTAPQHSVEHNSMSQSDQTAQSAETSDYIGVDRAKKIALDHEGIAASKVTFTKAKLDSDDGIKTYEVEFISGNIEYEYEINAYTGTVMDISKESIDGDDDHYYDD